MSDYAHGTIQRTLMQLKPDDWVGRSVLAREAALLFSQAVQMSGCGLVHTSRPLVKRLRHSNTLCPAAGCFTPFTRNADLLRHIASKHATDDTAKRYTCPAVGCLKHDSTPTFPRCDKLTDHILAAHKHAYSRFTCHAPACEGKEPTTLAGLVEHFETCREGWEMHGKAATRNALQRMQ